MGAGTDHSGGSLRMQNSLPQTLYPRDLHLVLGVSPRDRSSPLPISVCLTDVSARGARSQKSRPSLGYISFSLSCPASSRPTSDPPPNLPSSPLQYTQLLTSPHLPPPSLAGHPLPCPTRYHAEAPCCPLQPIVLPPPSSQEEPLKKVSQWDTGQPLWQTVWQPPKGCPQKVELLCEPSTHPFPSTHPRDSQSLATRKRVWEVSSGITHGSA